ncbi:hypothetical protein [uncultured Methylobacterium sp.]|uniref:ORC-CDC6 family AAA ATPase n=1 Tax=uncultured Methylobacterium sp. TaxID=157278 RepID=UPI00261D60A9|nr:hypothetical protein [uncultured Methylobacterium sp.]
MTKRNPFAVTTPEYLTASEANDLFVSDVPGYRHLREPGHAFLNGARGSGKSMIFRFLEPDCQRLANRCSIQELPFIGIYVPNKSPQYQPSELAMEERNSANLLYNEHALVLHVINHAFRALAIKTLENTEFEDRFPIIKEFFHDVFLSYLERSMWDPRSLTAKPISNSHEVFKVIRRILEDMLFKLNNHFKAQLAQGTSTFVAYDGALLGFSDFVAPLFEELHSSQIFGSGKFYLLIDDADELSTQKTEILNSWIFARTTGFLSVKASTQLRYKTYLTSSRRRIESPHDFAEINISDVYTSDKHQGFNTRLTQIVKRRLQLAEIEVDPSDYFPEDPKQKSHIQEIHREIHDRWEIHGKGARSRDDTYRYARAEYITRLGGDRKQSSKYSYSGFETLIDISSGVIREFLDAATEMFDRTSVKFAQNEKSIKPHVQSSVTRTRANNRLRNIPNEMKNIRDPLQYQSADIKRLNALIMGLGSLFKEILRSPRSERRVFSFAISDQPDEGLLRILELAIEMGLIQTSTIGRKEGFGRTRLYILTRQIAPVFNLDPSGFSGYKFITSKKIWELMSSPTAVANILRSQSASYFIDDDIPKDLFSAIERDHPEA